MVKLRWGVAHPDEMRLEGAPQGIKFALGENPKRARPGPMFRTSIRRPAWGSLRSSGTG